MRARLVAPTLVGYRRSWLGADAVAGVTLAAIAVPEQIAIARLANMPAIAGLYAFVAGSFLFALLGRNRRMSVGADSTIAPVLAAGVAAVSAIGTTGYSRLMPLLAIMVGVLVVAVGLLRLGWISEFLSTPVVTGVLAGIAVEIWVRQLPVVLGVAGGGTTPLGRLRTVVRQVGHTNGWAIAVGAAVLLIIVAGERIDRRIPGALIGVTVSTVVVAAFSLRTHGIRTLGTVRGGLASFAVPSGSMSDVRGLVGPALVVAFLCVAQTAATERASRVGQSTGEDFNRDLLAIGAASIVSGWTGSVAVNSSPPRTMVVAESGGRSQVAGATAAVVALAVALWATGLLEGLPQATLGAILVLVATKLFRADELRQVLRFDRGEFALALVALLAVGFVGIEQGIVAAMVLGLAQRTYRSARPHGVVLGRVPDSEHWIPTDVGLPTEQVAGVVVYLMYAPLWYANADYVTGSIRGVIDSAVAPVHALVLDANGVSDIDYTGARALGELAAALREDGVTVGIARSSHLVHHDLKYSGLLADIGPDHLFATVEEAVRAFTTTR